MNSSSQFRVPNGKKRKVLMKEKRCGRFEQESTGRCCMWGSLGVEDENHLVEVSLRELNEERTIW